MNGNSLPNLASLSLGLVLSLAVVGKALGQDEEVNLSTTITGNQEQPKVLYIVPWKAVNAAELENQTIESQLDIVFGHVEPVELRRELKYLKELSTEEE